MLSSDPVINVKMVPVIVVEDDLATQARLTRILTTLGVADNDIHSARNIADAEQLIAAHPFSLSLIDIGLPDGNGVDLIGALRAENPDVTAVVVSAWGTEDLIMAALQAGAVGYLLKEREDVELAASLRSIQSGGAPIDPFVAKHILRFVAQPAPDAAKPLNAQAKINLTEPLTPRELEILGLVTQGLISREIADKLSRSRLTVECHIKNIYRKMHVTTRTEAVFRARSLGLVQ